MFLPAGGDARCAANTRGRTTDLRNGIYKCMLIQQFEWDHEKSDANLGLRGVDFTFASRVFEGVTVEFEDRRRDYGERRIIALGVVDGIQLTAVYTDRTVAPDFVVRRIITAWRSNRRERTRYEKAVHGGSSDSGAGKPRLAS